jgi:hypothetical protein
VYIYKNPTSRVKENDGWIGKEFSWKLMKVRFILLPNYNLRRKIIRIKERYYAGDEHRPGFHPVCRDGRGFAGNGKVGQGVRRGRA